MCVDRGTACHTLPQEADKRHRNVSARQGKVRGHSLYVLRRILALNLPCRHDQMLQADPCSALATSALYSWILPDDKFVLVQALEEC